jgi:hypothetical protein
MCVAPFLQPLHGYPHHYYNMTAQGLENLFLPLRQRCISLYGAMHPIWALTWFLDRYAAGLADAQRERFLTMSVADLLAAPSSPDYDAVVSGLSLAARSELAAAHALTAIK